MRQSIKSFIILVILFQSFVSSIYSQWTNLNAPYPVERIFFHQPSASYFVIMEANNEEEGRKGEERSFLREGASGKLLFSFRDDIWTDLTPIGIEIERVNFDDNRWTSDGHLFFYVDVDDMEIAYVFNGISLASSSGIADGNLGSIEFDENGRLFFEDIENDQLHYYENHNWYSIPFLEDYNYIRFQRTENQNVFSSFDGSVPFIAEDVTGSYHLLYFYNGAIIDSAIGGVNGSFLDDGYNDGGSFFQMETSLGEKSLYRFQDQSVELLTIPTYTQVTYLFTDENNASFFYSKSASDTSRLYRRDPNGDLIDISPDYNQKSFRITCEYESNEDIILLSRLKSPNKDIIWKSDDNGDSWTNITPAVFPSFPSVTHCNTDEVWISGSVGGGTYIFIYKNDGWMTPYRVQNYSNLFDFPELANNEVLVHMRPYSNSLLDTFHIYNGLNWSVIDFGIPFESGLERKFLTQMKTNELVFSFEVGRDTIEFFTYLDGIVQNITPPGHWEGITPVNDNSDFFELRAINNDKFLYQYKNASLVKLNSEDCTWTSWVHEDMDQRVYFTERNSNGKNFLIEVDSDTRYDIGFVAGSTNFRRHYINDIEHLHFFSLEDDLWTFKTGVDQYEPCTSGIQIAHHQPLDLLDFKARQSIYSAQDIGSPSPVSFEAPSFIEFRPGFVVNWLTELDIVINDGCE